MDLGRWSERLSQKRNKDFTMGRTCRNTKKVSGVRIYGFKLHKEGTLQKRGLCTVAMKGIRSGSLSLYAIKHNIIINNIATL